MARCEVTQVSRAQAVAAMHAAGLRAAMPWDTPDAIAAAGECFTLDTEAGACVFVAHRRAGVLWVDAAAALRGAGITPAGLELAQEVARQSGCQQVAFQTVRPGLVRQAKKHGFEVAGYIMKKAVQ